MMIKNKSTVKKVKIDIEAEAVVNTYAHLMHSNTIIINLVKNKTPGNYYLALASMVFSAFTIEAYCNHIGSKSVKYWDEIERVSIKNKINILASIFKMEINWNNLPWQDIDMVLSFRNAMAHGKSETVSVKKTIELYQPNDDDFVNHAQTEWQKILTDKNAVRCYTSVKKAIVSLHKCSNLTDDIAFSIGINTKYSSIKPEKL